MLPPLVKIQGVGLGLFWGGGGKPSVCITSSDLYKQVWLFFWGGAFERFLPTYQQRQKRKKKRKKG